MKESLGQKQRRFAKSIAELIIWINEQEGYEVSMGDAYRNPKVFGRMGERKGYGQASSNHKIRLAQDLNLFKNGRYMTKTSDHEFIGKKWESMGEDHVWGGQFNDGNHYSIRHNGRA